MTRRRHHDSSSESDSEYGHRKRHSDSESLLRSRRRRRRETYSDGSDYGRSRKRGRDRNRRYRRDLVAPDLYASDEESRNRRTGSRNRGYRSRDRRVRDSTSNSYRIDKTYHESYIFQYGKFTNVVQLLYFGIVGLLQPFFNTIPEHPERDRPRCLFYDDKHTNEDTIKAEKLNQIGRQNLVSMNNHLQNNFLLKAVCVLMTLLPVLELSWDVFCVSKMPRPFSYIALLFLLFTFRNGLIGYFVHACYLWPLSVSLQTVMVILIPTYWGGLPFVGHPFKVQLEIAAWVGGICWPVRMIMQSVMAFKELTSQGRLSTNNTHLLQMAFVNAIARPLPMCLIKWIVWNQTKTSSRVNEEGDPAHEEGDPKKVRFLLEYLLISGALAVANFWYLWLQQTTHGAQRGVVIRRKMLNVVNTKPFTYNKYNDAITAIAWSPDNKGVLVGLDSGMLYWLEAENVFKKKTTRPRHEFVGHDDAVTVICFSRTGDYFLSTGEDSKVNVWLTSKRKSVAYHDFHHDKSVSACEVSLNERYVATSAENELCVWDWEGHKGEASESDCFFKYIGERDRRRHGNSDRREREYERIILVGFNENSDCVIAGGEYGSFMGFSLKDSNWKDKILTYNAQKPIVRGVSGFLTRPGKQEKNDDIWVIVCCLEVPKKNEKVKKGYQVLVYQPGDKDFSIISHMTYRYEEKIDFLAVCKDRNHCISCGKICNVWNMNKGTEVGFSRLDGTYPASCGAVSPDGKWVAVGSKSGVLSVFNFANPRRPPQPQVMV